MSKQRGRRFHGDRRQRKEHGSKHQQNAEQRAMKFDEERFLGDMNSALERRNFLLCLSAYILLFYVMQSLVFSY